MVFGLGESSSLSKKVGVLCGTGCCLCFIFKTVLFRKDKLIESTIGTIFFFFLVPSSRLYLPVCLLSTLFISKLVIMIIVRSR